MLEKQHKGVLTGAPLTDVRVELLTGRAHIKHTEGGDFRQSVYRAIRNALMYGESRLLEPICRFSMRAPEECYGRLAGDLSRMRAQIEPPEYDGDRVTLRGEAPFAALSGYQTEFLAATHGKGALTVRLSRYAPCRDEDAARIVAEANYNPLADDTPDSVFCQKGAGFRVAWDHVREWALLRNAGGNMNYTLVRSNRKTLCVSITPAGEVVVRAPQRLAKREIDRFVAAHAEWIAAHVEMARLRAEKFPEPDEAERAALIERAKAVLPPLVEKHARSMGVSPAGLKIYRRAQALWQLQRQKQPLLFALPDALPDGGDRIHRRARAGAYP